MTMAESSEKRMEEAMRAFLLRTGAAALAAGCIAAAVALAGEPMPPGISDGVITVQSAYPVAETVERLKQAVAAKGITYFDTIDQGQLGAAAGVKVQPSVLLVFGNPALGVQFLGGNPLAGLDWPVRLIVTEDAKGQVWTAYSDFGWIAKRHHITNRDEVFAKASSVIEAINDSIRVK
jgi:uncharacterized protein (DUF302 family)